MTTLDISAALSGRDDPRPSKEMCRLGRWLRAIPEDTPRRTELIEILTTPDQASPSWRSLEELDAVLRKLGFYTSNKTIANHRMKRCRCFL